MSSAILYTPTTARIFTLCYSVCIRSGGTARRSLRARWCSDIQALTDIYDGRKKYGISFQEELQDRQAF